MNRLVLSTPLLVISFFFSAGVEVNAQQDVDLEVTIKASLDTVRAGESFSYVARVRNIGTATAGDVKTLNDPPEEVEITSVSTSAGRCTPAAKRGDSVSCTIGAIEPNGEVLITFTSNISYREGDGAAGLTPYPTMNDWSSEIGTVSVDVVGADPNRSNNVARVNVDVEPRPNGLPFVRILSPKSDLRGDAAIKGRPTAITVKIQAYDRDGSVARVIVREPKYNPFPFVENGVYKFVYMGKKYGAAEMTAYLKANPPPIRVAQRSGTDMFEYLITHPQPGPNQLYVEVFDNHGKMNWTSIIFVVE